MAFLKLFNETQKRSYFLVLKDEVTYLLNAKKAVILLLLWPLLFALLIGAIYAPRVVTELPFVVVDQDQSRLSRTIVRYLDSTRSFMYKGQVESPGEILSLILKDEIAFGLVIPRGVMNGIKRGKSKSLQAYVNGSNLMVANLAYAEIRTVTGTISAGVMIKYLRKTGESKQMAMAHFAQIKSDSQRLFNPQYNYGAFLVPGLWISVFHQLLMLAGSLLISREMRDGSWNRFFRNADRNYLVALIGKLTPYFILALLLHAIWYFLLLPISGIDSYKNILNLELLTLIFVFATLTYGLMLSIITRNVINSLKAVLLIASPAFLLSGHTWPLEGMPVAVQWLARMIPLTHYLSAFRKLYSEDATLSLIFEELILLTLMGLISLGVSYVIFRFFLSDDTIQSDSIAGG